jgi:hypothetical protein
MWLCNPGDFDLPSGLRKAMMAQAKRNLNVLGVIGNTRSFGAFLIFSNRELRAKVWRMYVKGINENELTIKQPSFRFC